MSVFGLACRSTAKTPALHVPEPFQRRIVRSAENLRLIDHIVDKAVDTLQFQTAISQGALYRASGVEVKKPLTGGTSLPATGPPGQSLTGASLRARLPPRQDSGGPSRSLGQGRALFFRRRAAAWCSLAPEARSFLQPGEVGRSWPPAPVKAGSQRRIKHSSPIQPVFSTPGESGGSLLQGASKFG